MALIFEYFPKKQCCTAAVYYSSAHPVINDFVRVLCLHAVHISRMYVVMHLSHGASRLFRVTDSPFHSLGTPRRPRTNGTTRSSRTARSPGSPRWTASMSSCLRQNMHQGLSTTLLRGQKEEISPPAIKSATLTTTVPFLYSYSKQ